MTGFHLPHSTAKGKLPGVPPPLVPLSPCPLVPLSPCPFSIPSSLKLLHKLPLLPRQSLLQRILHHVINAPNHVVGCVEKHLVRTVPPDRVVRRNELRRP